MTATHSVLISYSSNDQHVAEKVLHALRSENINCWTAFENMRPGESWPAIITAAIHKCEIFLLILTKNSNSSRQVIRELTQADNLNKKLYCFQTEDIPISDEMQYFFASIHRLEAFKSGFETSLAKMANDIKLRLSESKVNTTISPAGSSASATKGDTNPAIEIPSTSNKIEEEDQYWKGVTYFNIKERYEMYLKTYPEGKYRDEAQKWLTELKKSDSDDEAIEINSSLPFRTSNKGKIIIGTTLGLVIFLFLILFRNSIWPVKDKTGLHPIDSKSVMKDTSTAALNPTGKSVRDTAKIVLNKSKPYKRKTVHDTNKTVPVIGDDNKIYTKVEIEASFPGGSAAWRKYIIRAIWTQIDDKWDNKSDDGTCIVKFIVDKTGTVSNVEATTMKGSRLAEIIINAIRKGPKWIPAQQEGRYVDAYRLQPVTFNGSFSEIN